MSRLLLRLDCELLGLLAEPLLAELCLFSPRPFFKGDPWMAEDGNPISILPTCPFPLPFFRKACFLRDPLVFTFDSTRLFCGEHEAESKSKSSDCV